MFYFINSRGLIELEKYRKNGKEAWERYRIRDFSARHRELDSQVREEPVFLDVLQ